MNTKLAGFYTLGLALAFAGCSGPASDENSQTDDGYTAETSDADTCNCESSWFNGNQIVPIDETGTGPFGPEGNANTTNCLFHQWSWNKFLYLTEPTDGTTPRFLTDLTQVNSEMEAVTVPAGASVLLDEHEQAGGGGILNSNATYGTGNIVYYSIHIDSTLKAASDSASTKLKNGTLSPTNRETFPVGSLELKISWINTTALTGGNPAEYYTTMASINGENVEVALLGMHVVGVVENHPEFIWATFEHDELAAFYDWEATTTADVPVTSTQNLPFFNSADQADLADIKWASGDSVRNPNNVFSIYQYGTPRVPGGDFMSGTSQADGEENFDNIQQLNQSVIDTLNQRGIAAVWTNYFYNGSIWMNTDGLSHDQQVDSILAYTNSFGVPSGGTPFRGSVNAFNITMETYEQTQSKTGIHDMGIDSLMNCFICHGPYAFLEIEGQSGATSPLYISHIFMSRASVENTDMTLDEIRATRIRLFQQYRARLKAEESN